LNSPQSIYVCRHPIKKRENETSGVLAGRFLLRDWNQAYSISSNANLIARVAFVGLRDAGRYILDSLSR